MDLKDRMQRALPQFCDWLGIELTHASPERIAAEVTVTERVAIETNTIHGGAIMAIADSLGSLGTIAGLAKGQWTTTLESKTNFFGPAPLGSRIFCESLPLHRGRRTQVWQTTLRNAEGKLLAQVTQTQMILSQPG
jgi:uncharacterized protein (TIGR00369 family)